MAKIQVIRRGESLPFSFDRGGLDISGYVCTIVVKQFTKDTALISRVVAPTDQKWTGFLTSTETQALNEGNYFITGELVNASTDENEEIPLRFQVSGAWAP